MKYRVIFNDNISLDLLQLNDVTRIGIGDDYEKAIFYHENKPIAKIDINTIEAIRFIAEENTK